MLSLLLSFVCVTQLILNSDCSITKLMAIGLEPSQVEVRDPFQEPFKFGICTNHPLNTLYFHRCVQNKTEIIEQTVTEVEKQSIIKAIFCLFEGVINSLIKQVIITNPTKILNATEVFMLLNLILHKFP